MCNAYIENLKIERRSFSLRVLNSNNFHCFYLSLPILLLLYFPIPAIYTKSHGPVISPTKQIAITVKSFIDRNNSNRIVNRIEIVIPLYISR